MPPQPPLDSGPSPGPLESWTEGGLACGHFGRRPYLEMLTAMRARVEARARNEVADVLWFVEHEGVYTAGRRKAPGDLRAPGLEVIEVERGGRLTWHGPGQLVVYPILELTGGLRDLHAWLRLLEEAVIAFLRGHGVEASTSKLGTGVFVHGRKIASIGIAVRRWVSYHGLALNLSPDLEAFRKIRPCGFEPERMTSLAIEGAGTCPEPGAAARDLAALLVPRIHALRARPPSPLPTEPESSR